MYNNSTNNTNITSNNTQNNNTINKMGCKQSIDKYHENELIKNNFDDLKKFTFDGLTTKCKIVDVHDGDTVTIVFYHNGVPIKNSLRLFGYDAPEIHPTTNTNNREMHILAGNTSRDILKKLLLDNIYFVTFTKEEKYGRSMGTLYKDDITKSINAFMIDNKLGKKYSGEKKQEFTVDELTHIINYK